MTKEGPAEDVFALQTALLLEGLYPPDKRDKNDCPRTGKLGPCTIESLNNFQKKYGITGETGTTGKGTLEKLNQLYSTASL